MPDPLPAIVPSIFSGRVAALGARGQVSAIDKRPAPAPWQIERTGLAGDEQADSRHHGGPEKALHHYPFDHYGGWREELGSDEAGGHVLLEQPGAFGENISTLGWTEETVHVGDIVRLGPVLLQVSQARQPCWKLDVRFGVEGLARRVQATGRTGWYYRVLEPGRVESGSRLTLEHRPQPAWPLARALRLLFRDVESYGELQDMAALPELADGWRQLAARRVAARAVEDWTSRLEGGSA